MKLYLSFIPLFFICSCCITGCKEAPKTAEKSPISFEVKITKTIQSNIDDSQQYLSKNPQYTFISNDSSLVADSQGYYLYVEQKYIKTIGKIGSASGEYKSNKVYTINADTLFIYDQANSKIIGYSLKTNTCVYEKSSSSVAQFMATSILRYQNRFILGDCIYYPSEMRQEKNIFAFLSEDGIIEEMPFTAKQSPSYSVIPGQVMPSYSSRLRYSPDKTKFYTYILFAPFVIIGDIQSQKISALPIELAMDESTKIVNGKIPNADKIVGVFPLQIGFATVSFVTKEEQTTLVIRYYSGEGKKVGELLDKDVNDMLFVSLTDNCYYLLKMNNPNEKLPYPYSLICKNYTTQKNL
jgi:hypothetical protein